MPRSKRAQRRDDAGKTRLQFVFDAEAVGRLDRLTAKLGESSRASTVRQAVALLEAISEETGDISSVVLLLPDGSMKKIRIVTPL